MRKLAVYIAMLCLLFGSAGRTLGQDTLKKAQKTYKNVIRYNLSGAMFFGVNRYVVFGYERVVAPHQSFSVNVGVAGLPKFASINTDSFNLSKDLKNNGFNISADYRFYLAKENRYAPPHGLYIGPYASYSHFRRDNTWTFQNGGSGQKLVTTSTQLNISTVGGELGYQFVLWKRLALDLVMIGPGLAFYDMEAQIQSNLSDAQKQQLQQAVEQLITQKFPGMNYVFSGKTFNGNGTIHTGNFGFRYIIHIGFVF